MANRYNDQDYPRYYERDDRYDRRSESRSFDRNRQRSNSGGGGSSDAERGNREEGYQGMSNDRDWGTNPQSGYPGGNFMSDFGRGYDQQARDTEDFESATRPARNYTGGFDRNTESDRDDYTLYGYNDRFSQTSGSERERGNYGRGGDYGYGGGSSSNYGSGADRERTRNFDRTDAASNYGRGSGSERGFDRYSDSDRNPSQGQSGGYVGTERGYDTNRNRSNRGDERGWWEKTSDEISSWFGDEEATRRRDRDQRSEGYQTSHRGRGPKNYRRSDDRIREDINDRLTDYPYLDASDIDVEVSNSEVTLTGTVESRYAKRMAEDIAEDVSGVSNVENRLRVKNQGASNFGSSSSGTSNFSSTSANTGTSDTNLTGGSTTGTTGAQSGASGSTTETSFGSSTGATSATDVTSTAGTTGDTSTGNTGDANTSATTGRARSKSA